MGGSPVALRPNALVSCDTRVSVLTSSPLGESRRGTLSRNNSHSSQLYCTRFSSSEKQWCGCCRLGWGGWSTYKGLPCLSVFFQSHSAISLSITKQFASLLLSAIRVGFALYSLAATIQTRATSATRFSASLFT